MPPRRDAFPPVLLASASPIRLDLLRRAGVAATAEPAGIDEAALKAAARLDGLDAAAAAAALACEKARVVAGRHAGAIVVGADQLLDLDGVWFDKPASLAAAAGQLRRLSGRRHRLSSAVAVAGAGPAVWQAVDSAWLTMRPLSDVFIDWYVAAAGPAILESVGAYQVEGLGIQLFERIEGDYFTILGMPLLPLLGFLRGR